MGVRNTEIISSDYDPAIELECDNTSTGDDRLLSVLHRVSALQVGVIIGTVDIVSGLEGLDMSVRVLRRKWWGISVLYPRLREGDSL
jgi:hypothetical protein